MFLFVPLVTRCNALKGAVACGRNELLRRYRCKLDLEMYESEVLLNERMMLFDLLMRRFSSEEQGSGAL